MCAACVYTRRAAPDWTAYYRENQFHQAFIAFIAEHDLGAWRWHEHRGRRRFGSTARARSTGGSRILLPWVCGVEERDTPRQRASVRALASLLAREGGGHTATAHRWLAQMLRSLPLDADDLELRYDVELCICCAWRRCRRARASSPRPALKTSGGRRWRRRRRWRRPRPRRWHHHHRWWAMR